jgi:hypothetical protein
MGSAEELNDGDLKDSGGLWNLLEEACRLLRGLIQKTDEWARFYSLEGS